MDDETQEHSSCISQNDGRNGDGEKDSVVQKTIEINAATSSYQEVSFEVLNDFDL